MPCRCLLLLITVQGEPLIKVIPKTVQDIGQLNKNAYT